MKQDKRISQHISQQPATFKKGLQLIRRTIHMAAPQAVETINYGIPMFQVEGRNLIGFAASKLFYAVYPSPPVIVAMQKELKAYSQNKGTVRFTSEHPVSANLIKKMVKLRMQAIQLELASKKRR